MVRTGLRVEGSGGGLSAAAWRPCGRLRTLAGRDGGERTQQETFSDRGGASLRGGWVVWWMGQAPSGRRWQGSQPSEGATELGFPGPVFGKMQSEAARLAGEPSGEGEEPSPQGLGGHQLLVQRPMRAAQRARLWAITPYRVRGRLCTASQAALAAKRPDGRWFNPTPYLRSRMAFSISAWRRWSASSSRVSPSRSVMKP